MTDDEPIHGSLMWTEANAVWSLDGWPGYPKNPLDLGGTFRDLENTVNAQGKALLHPKTQIGSANPPEGSGKTTGVKFPKKIWVLVGYNDGIFHASRNKYASWSPDK